MNRLFLIGLIVLPFAASAQSSDAINLSVPWITAGSNSLRLTGGFTNESGSFLKLTDSIQDLLGHAGTLHVSAEVGMRLRRVELGIRRRAAPGSRVEVGIDVYGQSFRYNQLVESSILSFNRNIGVFDNLNHVYPEDPINYVRSSYGARIFAEMRSASGLSRISFVYDYDVSSWRPRTDGTASWFGQLKFRGDGASGGLTGIQTGRLSASYLYNTIDNLIQPHRGSMFRGSVALAGLGGNVNFVEPDLEAKYYRRGFAGRHVLALHIRGRLIAAYDGKAAPPVDRYYMGGEDELRGFDSWSVGPIAFIPGAKPINLLNPDGSFRFQRAVVPYYRYTSIGGDTKLIGNAEYRIPLFGPVTLVLFDDAGIDRTTFRHQLQLNEQSLFTTFPGIADIPTRAIVAKGLQGPRMSLGAELEVAVPKVRIPVRLYWAWNPLAYRSYLPFPPVLLDRSFFPNQASFLNAFYQTAGAPFYREPRSRIQFSIGRTF